MKQTSTELQSRELLKIQGFPSPDIKFPPSGILDVETKVWSLGKMIEGLPKSFIFNACLEGDDEDVDYFLNISQKEKGNVWVVCYVSADRKKKYKEVTAKELIDAIFKMIMSLKKDGWYNT